MDGRGNPASSIAAHLPRKNDYKLMGYEIEIFDGDYDKLAEGSLKRAFDTPRDDDGAVFLMGPGSLKRRLAVLENGSPTKNPMIAEDAANDDFRSRYNVGVAAFLVQSGMISTRNGIEHYSGMGDGKMNPDLSRTDTKDSITFALPFDSENEWHRRVAEEFPDKDQPADA